ncbi:MAG: hypothetical protein KAG61_04130 [Bacteriovoracaceae bacterium]|nr:hypothetical protein [Bacteriovoracaceae bacterium]
MKTLLVIFITIIFITPAGFACLYSGNESMDGRGMSPRIGVYDELPIVTEQNWHKNRMTPKRGRFPSSVTPEEDQFMKKGFYYLDPVTGRTCLQLGDETDCEVKAPK